MTVGLEGSHDATDRPASRDAQIRYQPLAK